MQPHERESSPLYESPLLSLEDNRSRSASLDAREGDISIKRRRRRSRSSSRGGSSGRSSSGSDSRRRRHHHHHRHHHHRHHHGKHRQAKIETLPDEDWVCGVCSNLNSFHRDSCFRCAIPFSDNAERAPTNEIVVEGWPTTHGESDVRALLERLPSTADITIVRTAQRHHNVYVEVASELEAIRLLVACQCELAVDGAVCPLRFSTKAYASLHAVQPENLEEVEAKQHLPRALHWETWCPPTSFTSAEAEKDYLRLLSDHWQHLSAAQKGYYDARVLQVVTAVQALPASAGHGGSPTTATRSTPPSTVEKADAGGTMSRLKQLLAQKKAKLSQTEADAKKEEQKSETLADPSPAAPPKERTLQFVYGMPVPPCFDRNGDLESVFEAMRQPLILHEIPAKVAQHMLPNWEQL